MDMLAQVKSETWMLSVSESLFTQGFRIREVNDRVISVRRLLHSLTGLCKRACNRNMDWKSSLMQLFWFFILCSS